MKSLLCNLLFTASAVTALAIPEKRDSDITKRSTFTLYAYGDSGDIGGLPVTYSDGLAYIGTGAGDSVTFEISDTALSATSPVSEDLYITSGSTLTQVGFTSSASDDQIVTGFRLYGEEIVYDGDGGTFETYFYALTTDTDGVYTLNWGSDGLDDSSAIGVTLKSEAPS